MAVYFAVRELVKIANQHSWGVTPEFVEAHSDGLSRRGLLEIGHNFAMNPQGYAATAFLYICAISSFLMLLYYLWKYQKKQCGWEVIYVGVIETAVYVLELMWGHYYPAFLKICKRRTRTDYCIYDKYWKGSDRFEMNHADFIGSPWIRYCEWLMTCPVIIIALANLTGLKDDYNVRTMALLTTDQAMIVFGVTASFCQGDTKSALFVIGVLNGLFLAYMSFLVYAEAYENVPPNSKALVKYLAFVFFTTWSAFPIIMLLGPSTAEAIDVQGDLIAHCIADLFSKNLWGFLSLVLRDRVREHHRKLWFEEQARKQAGEKGFDVPKERRPSFRAAVNTFANALGVADENAYGGAGASKIENEIDPMYAEYRRRRRLRRGSLSVDFFVPPTLSVAGGAGQDAADDEDEDDTVRQQKDLQKAIAMLQQQQQQMQLQQSRVQTPAQPQMGFPSPVPPPSVSPPPGGMPYIHTPLGAGPPEVLVADPPEGQFGAFFKGQLELAAGARATHVRSADEVFSALRGAAAAGQRPDMLLVQEGLLDRTSLLFIRSTYKVSVVVYGAEVQDPSLIGADEFLPLPRPGSPYSNDPLVGACRRCAARRNTVPGQPATGGYSVHPVSFAFGGGAAAVGESSSAPANRADMSAMLADLAKLRSHAASVIPITSV